jgi:hypothetical protein
MRHRANADVRRLLWEIHRLKAIALYADQFMQLQVRGVNDSTAAMVRLALQNRLEEEPAIQDARKLAKDVTASSRTRRHSSGRGRE